MYTIILSEDIADDIDAARNYIALTLKNPAAADNLLADLIKTISFLEENPLRCPLVRDEWLASRGYRIIMVKNYILFFTVNEQEEIVMLIRFFHGNRNWIDIL